MEYLPRFFRLVAGSKVSRASQGPLEPQVPEDWTVFITEAWLCLGGPCTLRVRDCLVNTWSLGVLDAR